MKQYQNAQEEEDIQIAKMENEINKYVSANRDYEIEINKLKARIAELENLNSYSTTEKVIGTWIDGTPLYQKTFEINLPSTASKWVQYSLLDSSCNIRSFKGTCIYDTADIDILPTTLGTATNNNHFALYSTNSTGSSKLYGSIAIWVVPTSILNKPAIITLQYTKSTDLVPTNSN